MLPIGLVFRNISRQLNGVAVRLAGLGDIKSDAQAIATYEPVLAPDSGNKLHPGGEINLSSIKDMISQIGDLMKMHDILVHGLLSATMTEKPKIGNYTFTRLRRLSNVSESVSDVSKPSTVWSSKTLVSSASTLGHQEIQDVLDSQDLEQFAVLKQLHLEEFSDEQLRDRMTLIESTLTEILYLENLKFQCSFRRILPRIPDGDFTKPCRFHLVNVGRHGLPMSSQTSASGDENALWQTLRVRSIQTVGDYLVDIRNPSF